MSRAMPTARSGALRVEPPAASQAKPPAAIAEDDDPYWYMDEDECWNCGGEGYVYGCSWDWQCDTYDEGEGTCLCTPACHICHPPKPDPALQAVMAEALAAPSHTQEGENP